jgi:hypothetical protein
MGQDRLWAVVEAARRRLPDFEVRRGLHEARESELLARLREARRDARHPEPDDYFNEFEPTRSQDPSLAGVAQEIAARHRYGRIPSGPFVVTSWPDEELQARAQRIPGVGGVIYVSTGLVSMLRILATMTAASAGRILENPDLGPDARPEQVRALAEHSFVGAAIGSDFRAEAPAWSMHGARDRFRRQLTTLSVWSVVAHECGHLFGEQRGGGPECVAIDLRSLLDAQTESQVLNSQIDEMKADRFGLETLFVDRDQAPIEHLIVVALGAALSLSLQQGMYWVARGMDIADWGWSHPLPDIRAGILVSALDDLGLERPARRARRLLEWAGEAFGIDDGRSEVNRRLEAGAHR